VAAMARTIELDGKLRFRAKEVDDPISNRLLAAKF
jgi:hypothetical protein